MKKSLLLILIAMTGLTAAADLTKEQYTALQKRFKAKAREEFRAFHD
jgi:hypothetical protein